MNVALRDSELVFQAVNQLRQLKRNMLTDSFAFGKILYELGIKNKKAGSLYKLYASHVTTEGEFAKEIGMSLSSLHNIVGIYMSFAHLAISDNGVMEITPTRLIRLLPLNLKEEEKVEWLHRASEYDAKAFQNSINERQGKVTTDECEHDDEPWVKCKVCGDLRKV